MRLVTPSGCCLGSRQLHRDLHHGQCSPDPIYHRVRVVLGLQEAVNANALSTGQNTAVLDRGFYSLASTEGGAAQRNRSGNGIAYA